MAHSKRRVAFASWLLFAPTLIFPQYDKFKSLSRAGLATTTAPVIGETLPRRNCVDWYSFWNYQYLRINWVSSLNSGLEPWDYHDIVRLVL